MIFALLAVAMTWLVVVLALNRQQWRMTDPAAQTIAILAVLLVLRPTALALGLDKPFPDSAFTNRDIGQMITTTQFWIIVWIIVFTVTHGVFNPQRPTREPSRSVPPNDRIARFAPVLAGLAILTTLPFVVRYGGVGGLTSASKGRQLSGTARFFRTPSVFSAYLGAALATVRVAGAGRHQWRRRGWIVYLIGAGCSYAWGARDAAIFPLLFPLVAAMSRPRRLSFRYVMRLLGRTPRFLLAVALIAGASFALRTWRDVTLTGRVQSSILGQSRVRQIAVSSNLTQYDALLLVVADTPSPLARGGSKILSQAALSGLPSQLRLTSETLTPPSVRVAQHYDPSRQNGFPLTPVGDWYFALGEIGVLFGAAMSGFLAARLGAWARRQSPESSVATNAVVLLLNTSVMLGGVLVVSPPRAFNVLIPLALLGVLFRSRLSTLPAKDAVASQFA